MARGAAFAVQHSPALDAHRALAREGHLNLIPDPQALEQALVSHGVQDLLAVLRPVLDR
jgi:hypothetical protein